MPRPKPPANLTVAGQPPKHRAAYEALRQEILAGRYPPGSRMPGEAELVVRFGASRPTVARALNDLAREGLVERRGRSGGPAKGPPPPPPPPPPARTAGPVLPPPRRPGSFS